MLLRKLYVFHAWLQAGQDLPKEAVGVEKLDGVIAVRKEGRYCLGRCPDGKGDGQAGLFDGEPDFIIGVIITKSKIEPASSFVSVTVV